jgi:cell division protein FtsL
MIQTRLSLLRNKFFLLLGIIILLSVSFVFINSVQSNETLLQDKIEKLELQNDAYSKQIEGISTLFPRN